MERTTLEKLFTGKLLRVPHYQRDYAWEPENVDDLWNDIQEMLALSVSHYLGTFILANAGQGQLHDIVDGQQRLITLTMLLKALIDRLPVSPKRVVAEDRYVRETSGKDRLNLLGANAPFFQNLLVSCPANNFTVHNDFLKCRRGQNDPTMKTYLRDTTLAGQTARPQTRGQKRMVAAYQRLCERADQLAASGGNTVEKWIDGISNVQVLEFIERDEGNAIRIFETVNDRGVPLATIDKIKSFLIYTSNRYLGGALDQTLQNRFGRIFVAFDQVKEVGGEGLGIELLKAARFTEDDVVRYHFFGYESNFHDWKFTASDVLTLFLKPAVKNYAARGPAGLRVFVDRYSEDLARFFEALSAIVRHADSDPDYYKLFVFLGLSAAVYPLAIRLAVRNLLDVRMGSSARTFLDGLGTIDVRIYKPRSRHPEKEIAQLAAASGTLTPAEIATRMKNFILRWRGDDAFRAELSGPVYEQNDGVAYILLEYEEKCRKEALGKTASVDELKDLGEKEPTIDHILAQTPTFSFPSRGFKDEQEYKDAQHHLGNLTLVEKRVNSAAQDKTPEQKASLDPLYKSSLFASTRQFAAGLSNANKQFDAASIQKRTTEIRDFCLRRWSVWA